MKNDAATKWLSLAMETDKEIKKKRLEKMVARLALETEEERRAILEHLSEKFIIYMYVCMYVYVTRSEKSAKDEKKI